LLVSRPQSTARPRGYFVDGQRRSEWSDALIVLKKRPLSPQAGFAGGLIAVRFAIISRPLHLLCDRVCFALQSKRIPMGDLDKALADIFTIRSQIAAGTAFRGYGPATIAATGGLALITTVFQYASLPDSTRNPLIFFLSWTATALVSTAMIWIEMQARSRRHHSGLADAMIHQAVEQFLPAAVAGALLAVMLWNFAPEALWMLPGLWQVMLSLGVFASVRFLPRAVGIAGAWYFVTGFVTLMLASQDHALSPWTMGLPFAIGQLLMAAILHFAPGGTDVED
jgi:hypothetical protein